jgi:hypothetical protein
MLDDNDAADVLERVRLEMAGAEFEDLDEHAAMIAAESTRYGSAPFLDMYLRTAIALLNSIGSTRVDAAKQTIRSLLAASGPPEFVVEISPGLPAAPNGRRQFPLDGSRQADQVAAILTAVARWAANYQPPPPTPPFTPGFP